MRLRFSKMHGLGNDFVMIDAISQKVRLSPEKVRKLADRRLGVGCDQVLIVEEPRTPDVDFRYRIYNADGTEVENCGNGARCFASFVRERKLTGKQSIKVETAGGILELHITEHEQVKVDMGPPVLTPREIPFEAPEQSAIYHLEHAGEHFSVSAVSMGNPHAVLLVDSTANADVARIGPLLEKHPAFPNKANIGFMQIVSRSEINLRVFERGAGETLACGTGACAAVVAGRLRDLLDSNVTVNLPGGSLSISWAGGSSPVFMTGPTTQVFQGQVKI